MYVPNDVWRYIITVAIPDREYHTKLALSRACSQLRNIYNTIIAGYTNIYGREIYCGDDANDADKYAGHSRHGVVRTTYIYRTLHPRYTGRHIAHVNFMGCILIHISFDCNVVGHASAQIILYLPNENKIDIYIDKWNCRIYFNRWLTHTCFDGLDGIVEYLTTNYDPVATELWETAMGLRDAARFINTMIIKHIK